MPKVPQYNHKPLKSLYYPNNPDEPASFRQKDLIIVLYQRRKLPVPDVKQITKGEATKLIDNLLNDRYFNK